MSKGKKKENNEKGFNAHYNDRAEKRPKQLWRLRTGEPAAHKGAKGAIPFYAAK